MKLKDKIEDYTETEFLLFVTEFFENTNSLTGDALSAYTSNLALHFEKITEHPRKRAVIFRPTPDREDSAAGVVEEIKKWRQANGKPGFKAE
ncbi:MULTISPECIES: bacteriocin immunity protein [Pseudomonas]|uniref:Colicin/pyocin immunity family protein n=1 Tax=Pseudomonas fluorescens (strain Pf0-1) TaxID=205922 RepID=Q3K4W9_PSEPF|nr:MULTISPECIES: bacteriocin immunity protein [Pseudomonas]ABA77185.1 colicin/pyocin immunity family protein [Pseudomonas fluorescens Pf0-1]MBL0796951.1 bacteriocin immunity protein [Pseudomonas sp. B7]MBX8624634.1 bacteriocin immunity protein [Pseudomonas glycinae]MBY9022375.1 bacteriocin immunity protein [Pseudomonas fluorescens]MBY9028368.1 bacteriocin immunity protein [Pseudomonas fluorescens]